MKRRPPADVRVPRVAIPAADMHFVEAFFMVGTNRIGNVREFEDQVLTETAGQNADEYSIRVVYNFSTVDFDGARTAHLKITKEDLKQLQMVSHQLTPESQ